MKEKTFDYLLYWVSIMGIAGFSWVFIGLVTAMIFPQLPTDMALGCGFLINSGIIFILWSLLIIGVIYIIHLSEILVKRYVKVKS